jgi:hypothetical protein
MDFTRLNLDGAPKPKSINFSDQNAVEKFLETEKFRPCANLECSEVNLHNAHFYMPMCREGRFDRHGIADFFEMPVPARPCSPITYMSLAHWAPLISCPPDCKGYKNRHVAKTQKAGGKVAGWLFEHILKPAEIFWAAVWAWLFK